MELHEIYVETLQDGSHELYIHENDVSTKMNFIGQPGPKGDKGDKGDTGTIPEELEVATILVTKAVYVGEKQEGITAEIKAGDVTLVFQNGILVKYG